MDLSTLTSPSSSVISLGDEKYNASEYLNGSDIFHPSFEPSLVPLSQPPVSILEEPSDTSLEAAVEQYRDIGSFQVMLHMLISTALKSGRGTPGDDTARALAFERDLQEINRLHGFKPIFLEGILHPMLAMNTNLIEDIGLSSALDRAIGESLYVEGGGDEKEQRDDYIKISRFSKTNDTGKPVNCIRMEDLQQLDSLDFIEGSFCTILRCLWGFR